MSRLPVLLLLAIAIASAQARGYDPAIREPFEATRRVLREFTNDLPNFACEQQTRRFRGTGKVSDWRTLDRLTANMILSARRRVHHKHQDQRRFTSSNEQPTRGSLP